MADDRANCEGRNVSAVAVGFSRTWPIPGQTATDGLRRPATPKETAGLNRRLRTDMSLGTLRKLYDLRSLVNHCDAGADSFLHMQFLEFTPI